MTVVVGYIPSPQGEAALTAAVEEAERRDARLVVLNFSRDDVLADPSRATDDQLARVSRDLEERGISTELRRVDHGNDPAAEILRVAEEEDAAVLVIGLRHRSPVGKLVWGSTAQQVLLDATCPVLAVKPR